VCVCVCMYVCGVKRGNGEHPVIEGADTESHLHEASGFCIHRRSRIRRGVPYLTGRYRPELCVTYRQIMLPSPFQLSARFRPSRNCDLRQSTAASEISEADARCRRFIRKSRIIISDLFFAQIVFPCRKYLFSPS